MKQNNQKAILNALFYENLSRADLARRLGLTRASLSDHMDELIASGLVMEMGAGKSELGRKPVLLDINPEFRFVGGLYMSRSICRLGLTDLKGRTVKSADIGISPDSFPNTVMDDAAKQWRMLMEYLGIGTEMIMGFGVSVPGPVNTEKGIILSPPLFERWHNYPIAEKLEKLLGVKVALENNASSLTLAEMRFGLGRECRNFIYIVVDSGIGGGLIQDGRFFRGVNGFGGEIGHTSIIFDGRRCSCGNIGCVERYACIPVLLKDMFSPEEGFVSWAQVVDGALSMDIRCMGVMEREAEYLACVLTNLVNVFEPEKIAFGGDLLYKPETIAAMLSDRLNRRAIMRGVRSTQVIPSMLTGEINVLAAATIAINEFFA